MASRCSLTGLLGFLSKWGGVGAVGNLGGSPVLNSAYAITLFSKTFGPFGQGGFFLMHNHSYDVMVIFLFQMVFMDTALTIFTGSAAERWKFAAFLVSSFVLGAFIYPLFANWAWGGGWSGAFVGGLRALALAILIGPRIGKFSREGKPHAIPRHDMVLVLTGCFILAFGWSKRILNRRTFELAWAWRTR